MQSEHHSTTQKRKMQQCHMTSTFLALYNLVRKNGKKLVGVTKPSDKVQIYQSSLRTDSIVDCLKVPFSPQDVIQQGRNTLLIYYYKPMI